ncbi:hypothetical protein QBC39DRAFT_398131 [Podospora conica]|nr:hypothetical protein QBC39DRAFT_398131 [Schizothecium conicum]
MSTPLQYPFRLDQSADNADDPVFCAADNHILEVIALASGHDEREGDVLAIVTFPADANSATACDGRAWVAEDWRLRMSSEKLKSLGSAKIAAMFEPGLQTRIRRRLGILLLPPGINYVLDFSPHREGAELAEQTVALWLPKTVKLWFLAGHYIPDEIIRVGPKATPANPTWTPSLMWQNGKWVDDTSLHKRPLGDKCVGATLVLGHDDACKSDECLKDLDQWRVSGRVRGIFDESFLGSAEDGVPSWRLIEDYCPIRHRAAIVRILRAINGHDLLLNSAPRMWTVAQVAIYLEIPQVVLDPVAQWLIAPPNTKFIEICPERAFQLARSLQIPLVLTAAFRILVNELAIDYLFTDRSPGKPALTWVGRRRDDYGDFPSDPVEYAARSMQERSIEMVDKLLSDTALDELGNTLGRHSLPEWKKLRKIGEIVDLVCTDPAKSSELVLAYRQLVGVLVSAFKMRVMAAFKAPINDQNASLIAAQRAHYIPGPESESVSDLYEKLNHHQRVLTPIFWRNLKTERHQPYDESTAKGSPIWRLDLRFDLLFKHAMKQLEEDAAGYHPPPPFMSDIDTDLKMLQFSLPDFQDQLQTTVVALCTDMLRVHDNSGIPFYLSDHLLLNLSEKEQNFLPIWAEGLDDGSGGVFQEAIPPTDMGPSEPGPAYHTGHTIATDTNAAGTDCTSSIAPSDLGMDRLGIYSDTSTNMRSVYAQQSATASALPRGRVVAASESIPASERFTPTSSDVDFRDAVLAHPAPASSTDGDGDGDDARTISAAAQDEDDMAWSTLSSELGGIPGRQPPQLTLAAATVAAAAESPPTAPAQASPTFDDFGLENDDDDEMTDFGNGDDDDDGTSTLDGSEYDFM